jgi:hypothetical protein
MPVIPLPGVQPTALLDALRQVASDLNVARLTTGETRDRLIAYGRWVMNSASHLGQLVRADDVDRLVLTRRQWALQAVDPFGPPETLGPLLNLEFDERARCFDDIVSQQEAIVRRWVDRTGLVVVADTNVYVEHDDPLEGYDWAGIVGAGMEPIHLVVPMIIVDELDKMKRNHRKGVPARARQTLQALERLLLGDPLATAKLAPATAEHGPVSLELLVDEPGHVRLDDADDELVDRAVALSGIAGRKVSFVTGDHGALFRGAIQGLKVHHLPVPDSR